MDARVLDACCGSRMFWFDKADSRALFVDKRREVCTDPRGREVVIDPDVLGDFTALPFEDGTFSMVVFDPPHTFNGVNSAMAQKYGRLEPGWREQITAGFAECFRVLRDGGTLIFKWNEHRVPVKTVLSMTSEKPLFGHRSGSAAKTHWIVFMKAASVDTHPAGGDGTAPFMSGAVGEAETPEPQSQDPSQ
jgi:SAM-dependent methyltransferase